MRPPGHVISRTSSALKTNFASCSFIFFMGLHIKMMSYTLSTMPVIVLDTNVFVSALRSEGGASREVLRCILLGRYMPLLGNALRLEDRKRVRQGKSGVVRGDSGGARNI